jgi:3-dehydroquinate synthetase
LPTQPPPGTDVAATLGFLGADKKRKAGSVRCVLLQEAGRVAPGQGWSHALELASLRAVLD